jgi:hypothetical protein
MKFLEILLLDKESNENLQEYHKVLKIIADIQSKRIKELEKILKIKK